MTKPASYEMSMITNLELNEKQVVAIIIRTLGIFKRFQLFLLNWPLQYP